MELVSKTSAVKTRREFNSRLFRQEKPMALAIEVLRDTTDPDEDCFIVKFEGNWIGRIRKLEDGWEARSNEGFKGAIHYSSPERAAQALVFAVAL